MTINRHIKTHDKPRSIREILAEIEENLAGELTEKGRAQLEGYKEYWQSRLKRRGKKHDKSD